MRGILVTLSCLSTVLASGMATAQEPLTRVAYALPHPGRNAQVIDAKVVISAPADAEIETVVRSRNLGTCYWVTTVAMGLG